ncbi:MAG: hypothetical protein A2W11_12190 [Ignavibacteria bacterium RBG_16_35_7]|nr:MAG: hypothetical protein A2W11_12190 [Ignavibacteria bacterium RBG_16_35_7]
MNLKINEKYKSNAEFLKDYVQIVDINDDKVNEVVFTPRDYSDGNSNKRYGSIICLDKYKQMIWEYTFSDTMFCDHEILIPEYEVNLIDTVEIKSQKVILCSANNVKSFSSAVFSLELKSGKRNHNTFWTSGHIWDGLVVDTGSLDKKYFVGIGGDNGFHDGAVWGMDLEKLYGYRPSTKEYIIKNQPETEFIFCIRLPKTDFDNFIGSTVVGISQGSLTYDRINKNFGFNSISYKEFWGESIAGLQYTLSDNFKDFNISVTDQFKVHRNSLVANGTLKEPYTNTKEFVELYKSKILYWQV